MITFRQTCYEARVSDDFNNTRTFGYFINEWDAERAVEGKSSWGGDGTVRPTTVDIVIYESWEDFKLAQAATARERALAKLTDEEKEVLGIKQ